MVLLLRNTEWDIFLILDPTYSNDMIIHDKMTVIEPIVGAL